MKNRVECCQILILQYEECDVRRLYEIATVDETWIYFSQPKPRKNRSVGCIRRSPGKKNCVPTSGLRR